MQMPQPDNQEPKDPNSHRSPQKSTKTRGIFRYGVPALVVLMVVLLVGIIAARAISSNFSHYNTQE